MTTCFSRFTLSTSSTTMWSDWEITLPRVGEKSTNACDGMGVPRAPSRTGIDSATVLINTPPQSSSPGTSLLRNARPLQEDSPSTWPVAERRSSVTGAPCRPAAATGPVRSGPCDDGFGSVRYDRRPYHRDGPPATVFPDRGGRRGSPSAGAGDGGG